jgi:hypothetical protein
MVNCKFLVILVLLFSVLLAGCSSTDECREDKTVNMKIGFYKKTDLTDATLTLDSVWANGLEKDSFLYDNSKSVNSLKLPLNAARQQSDFIVRFNNTTDTLSVFYTINNAYFISFECGCIATQTIDEVISTNHFIDSVRIVQREVINVNAEHIKIFHN